MLKISIGIAIILFLILQISNSQELPFYLTVSTHELNILVNETQRFKLLIRGNLTKDLNVTFIEPTNIIDVSPPWIILNSSNIDSYVYLKGIHPGQLLLTADTEPSAKWISKDIVIRVIIFSSKIIYNISIIFGWIYFITWSASFYPQIISNFRRKSVVGLNFDFVLLNIVGFVLYSLFNIGLYWIPEIQDEYFKRKPGLNPVLANDIFFSTHAVFATGITIVQCFLYERGDQRISRTTYYLLLIFSNLIIISVSMAATNIIQWLDFLYICSYIKLSITLIKYIPQAVMNFKRKSTVGWSIGNILLDFIGGTLSMLQMILNAYNYDDWSSIFGDPTKFGLGLFSVCFDIFFMLQHYVFYRRCPPYLVLTDLPENPPENEQNDT